MEVCEELVERMYLWTKCHPRTEKPDVSCGRELQERKGETADKIFSKTVAQGKTKLIETLLLARFDAFFCTFCPPNFLCIWVSPVYRA